MRPDGKRVKGLPPLVAAIPYIMPKRYDAQNTITEYIDEDVIKNYLRQKRREGHRLSHMSVVMAAYYKAALEHPKVNYFVMNSRIYERTHFCVSFVLLKMLPDGGHDQTTLKVHLQKSDNVFKIHQRTQELIDRNLQQNHANSTDKFASFLMSLPILPKLVVGLASFLDKHNLLPKFIIELSPFHTSLFITNLASIKTSFIHHHCYEFGTTSVFLCMGKPVPGYAAANMDKKMMPLGVVMDERICTGYEYATFCNDFRHYLRHPEELEMPFDGSAPAEAEASVEEKEVAAV